jgi:hypothetical protein
MARAPRIAEGATRRIGEIWGQQSIPVLLRPQKEPPLFVRLPYAVDNRAWLQACGRINPKSARSPKTGKTHWEVPMAWFGPLIRRCVTKYGQVYVIQPLNRAEVCAGSCWNAKRDLCECSCLGTNHGGGKPAGNWKEISEAFAIQWSGGELACRLIMRPSR